MLYEMKVIERGIPGSIVPSLRASKGKEMDGADWLGCFDDKKMKLISPIRIS